MTPLEATMKKNIGRPKMDVHAHVSVHEQGNSPQRTLLSEDAFISMLYLERRRAERAQKRFVLVLVDVKKANGAIHKDRELAAMVGALSDATRETDIIGWYLENSLFGVIGTELGNATNQVVQESFLLKIRKAFEATLGREKTAGISLSFHFFPEEYAETGGDHSANITLYPELQKKEDTQRTALALKRFIDVIGSAAALLVFGPIFAAIAVFIKFTSKGPVLFKQERLGQYGKPFTVLKFRSMRTDCDSRIHQEYVSQFIAGKVEDKCNDASGAGPVFKIQMDPRITPIGQFLRKTSLDELPQFWNVLRGDMSLVGPRPPIAYEFRAYDVWHRRRVLEIKPGITGLWQVEGRSRTRFDDMVRLDLRYARSWSIWLDLRILLQTPGAVILGDGAH
jgi:lipopolysaccharide/colanic/teichoic acid biosynthesis glycosyltransferase